MTWSDLFMMVGTLCGVAALALNHAEVARPDPMGGPLPKRLNEMLVNLLAGLALVMIAVMALYMRGVVLPLSVGLLAYLGYRRAARLTLIPFYKFKFPLAGTALAAAIAFWLGAL